MVDTAKKQRIILIGAAGRMGRTICHRFLSDETVEYVGAVDPNADGEFAGTLSGHELEGPKIYYSAEELPVNLKADTVLDFSIASATRENIEACLSRGWNYVIGATGFEKEDHIKFTELAKKYNKKIVMVPNFTPGMNLMLRLLKDAAELYEHAEIIELHHDRKLDAPSGTALYTAKLLGELMGDVEIPIHSVRLPGLLAHQEVIFGSVGEVFTIRHDTTDRGAFQNGIYLALKNLNKVKPGFTIGLDWAL